MNENFIYFVREDGNEVMEMMLESEILKYWTERWYERLMYPEDDTPPIFPDVRPDAGS